MSKIIINHVVPEARGKRSASDIRKLVKYIILHDIKFDIKQTKRIFNQQAISAHYYIAVNGDTHELVALVEKAFHTGVSKFNKDTNLNDLSIGIELQSDWSHVMPDDQYKALISLLEELTQKYDVKILSHAEIAPYRIFENKITPGKIDPGINFPWQKLAKNSFGIYHEVKLNKDPVILHNFGEKNEQILFLQEALYNYGYSLTPKNSVYNLQTAAILNSFYLRYYPQWFQINENMIKEAIRPMVIGAQGEGDDIKTTIDLTKSITDQWIFNNINYWHISNIDENSLKIMAVILGMDLDHYQNCFENNQKI